MLSNIPMQTAGDLERNRETGYKNKSLPLECTRNHCRAIQRAVSNDANVMSLEFSQVLTPPHAAGNQPAGRSHL